MPRQKDLKKLVRTRMSKTGEAYTVARAQIVQRKDARKTAAEAPEGVSVADYARIAGMSDTAVQAKTGCTWERWVKSLDHHGAATMPHGEIAAMIHEKWKVGGWWSQMVAVGYERIKGLRDRGQRRAGHYDASKSKTLNVPAARVFEALTEKPLLARWLPEAVRVRTASEERSARLTMQDGSIAAFWFTKKGEGKTALSVQQQKLPDKATRERMKRYWGERLEALKELLSS
ncbi:MAG TPA: hypothetical protein VJV23_02475 [Candidatus Polarisedimenticolia bacterium]|nr:hypothetical protein [Candidatus Polarisedimenticolia bacterium]